MRATVRQVADGTFLVHGTNTNWVILTEGDAVTLIDTGYPDDREGLLGSLAEVGAAPEAVAAVLITHAHNDHLGSAEFLSAAHGTSVYTHKEEVPHARRDFLHQVTVARVLRNGWRPGVLPWAAHALRAGGTANVAVTSPQPFPVSGGGEALDLPGGRCPSTPPATPPGTAPSTCRTSGRWCPATPWSAGTPSPASRARRC